MAGIVWRPSMSARAVQSVQRSGEGKLPAPSPHGHSSACAFSPQPQAVYKLSLTLDPQDLGQHSGMPTGNPTRTSLSLLFICSMSGRHVTSLSAPVLAQSTESLLLRHPQPQLAAPTLLPLPASTRAASLLSPLSSRYLPSSPASAW